MKKNQLIIYPNNILTQKTRPVESINREIKDLIKEMKKIMRENNGVGLAANQIGIDLSIFIAQENKEILTFINPKITKLSGKEILMEEGCLSLPKIWGYIKRYPKVSVEYLDLWGKKRKLTTQGLLAQIIQHETDHLNGILFAQKSEKLFKLEEIEKEDVFKK